MGKREKATTEQTLLFLAGIKLISIYPYNHVGGHVVKKKGIGKKLRKFSFETRLKSSEKFKEEILKLFKGYIKSIVVWGSIVRGDFTGKSDVDIYTIFDDTKMPLKKFEEIRPKIDRDIYKIAHKIDPRLHPQPILALTEFWDGIRKIHPLFYNIVREGYAIHDTGFFIPMRKLLEWGKFPATPEASALRIKSVPQRISRVKNIKTMMIAEDLYMAMTDSAQAALMFVGVGPPPPKQVAEKLRDHFVRQKLLDDKYVKMYSEVLTLRKKVEHKELKHVTGQQVDDWIAKTEDFVKTMHALIKRLELQRKITDTERNYEVMLKSTVAALKALDKLPPDPKNLPKAFNKYLIDSGLVNPMYKSVFEKVLEMKKLLKDRKLHEVPDRDMELTKEYVRRFTFDARRIIGMKDKIDVEKLLKNNQSRMVEIKAKMEKAKSETETGKEIAKLPEKTKAIAPTATPKKKTEKQKKTSTKKPIKKKSKK
jgi:uncharacterized protein (UPF0332 family)/predicted nucleotidyltransferase